MQSRRSQSANSASSGNTIASNSSKRPRKRKSTEPSTSGQTRVVSKVKAQVGDKLKVYYGPTQSESKVTYEAKVIEISPDGSLRVHYTGWNTRYDEWIKPQRIALNVTQHEQRNKKNTSINRRVRVKRTEESSARSDSDSSDSDDDVKMRPSNKSDGDKSTSKTPARSKDVKSSDSSSSSKPRKRPVRTISTPTAISPAKKPRTNVTGRDFDLNEIRSELKGLHTVKQEPEETIKQELPEKEPSLNPTPSSASPSEPPPEKQAEDVYEFKEPEPFELELHDEKKKRTHRIFDDISPSKYTSTLSKSLSEEISEDPMRPRPPSLRSPSSSPFRETIQGQQSPEEDSKDGIFSLDDDSFPGDGTGLTFEGFTPAKNQETYSKKSKVSKLRELIDDSPESPADDEQSSEDEQEDITIKEEEREPTPVLPAVEESKSPEQPVPVIVETKEAEPLPPTNEEVIENKEETEVEVSNILSLPEPPKTPPPQKDRSINSPTPEPPKTPVASSTSVVTSTTTTPPSSIKNNPPVEHKEEIKKEEPVQPTKPPTPKPEPPKAQSPNPQAAKALPIALPTAEPKENPLKIKIEKKPDTILKFNPITKMDPVQKLDSIPKMDPIEPDTTSKILPPSSPLIDTEEDKSEPDSPARIDVIPEPPPGFLLQSEGPKIAEKLLKAISSAKRLSMSPPPKEDRPLTPKTDPLSTLKLIKPESKLSPISPEARPAIKPEPIKPLIKIDLVKKVSPTPSTDPIFGEPSNLLDMKRDVLDVKKAKPDDPTPPRLQSPLSPLNILERRKSVADLPLSIPGKNNKVLSDTIQKLSSQINQSVAAAAAASLPMPTLPPFPSADRSESSDSDDSDTRLIIDKLAVEEWGSGASSETVPAVVATVSSSTRALHAGKSEGEWSAGETLLMLEDACKNERKHSASVVVAGSGRLVTTSTCAPVSSVSLAVGEDDSNISLLLCSETIPGSPAPDAEPAPPRQRLHMPFASAPPHQHCKDDRRGEGGSRAGASTNGPSAGAARDAAPPRDAGGGREPGWGRTRPLIDNTPPTTPDSSLDMSPHRERRISERDSPTDRKDDEDDCRGNDASGLDMDKPHGRPRSRKASESSLAGGARRARRPRRDTDDAPSLHHSHHAPLKYNFYVDLDPSWDCHTRINVLTSRLADLRKAYHSVKAELAAIDRRRKKLRRKEREAVKAAKAACS